MFQISLSVLLTGIAGLFIAALFVIPAFQDIRYRFEVYRRKVKYGTLMPKVIYNIPFGIPGFLFLLRASKKNRLAETLEEVFHSTGRLTVRRQVLGRFAVSTMDPENIKAILATQFKEFGLGNRKLQLHPLLGEGVFTLDGPGWQHTRAMLRPQFSREQVSHLQTLEVHVNKLVSIVANSRSEFVDLQELFFKLTIDTATQFLFGESVETLSGGNPNMEGSLNFGDSFNRAQKMLALRSRAQKYYFLFNNNQFKKDCQVCRSFTDMFVQRALKRTADKASEKNTLSYVFLEELTKETRDPVILNDQALNILLAGRDTTASLLSFAFYELSVNPRIFNKLREAIFESFGDGTEITFESLKRCDYLRYVINESLRLYPTVPFNSRYPTQDTTLPRGGGPDGSSPMLVEKGSPVLYSVFVMHRSPLFWGEDAHVFRPERWMPDERRHNAHAWDYLPFNGGPRICLGQQFALTEASYTIVKLLQAFSKLEAQPEFETGKAPISTSLTICVHGGVNVKFEI